MCQKHDFSFLSNWTEFPLHLPTVFLFNTGFVPNVVDILGDAFRVPELVNPAG